MNGDNKLASRKLWVAIGGILAVLAANAVSLPWYGQLGVVALGMGYVMSQALVDAAKEIAPAIYGLAEAIKGLKVT